jgi:hypothetical protein
MPLLDNEEGTATFSRFGRVIQRAQLNKGYQPDAR